MERIQNSKFRNRNKRPFSRNKKKRTRPNQTKSLVEPAYRYQLNIGATQWGLMSTPKFSLTFSLDTLTLAARNTCPVALFKPSRSTVRITVPVDTVTSYRIITCLVTTRYTITASTDPLLFLYPQPTTTNFWASEPYLPRDQQYQYKIFRDHQFVIDTHGIDKLTTEHFYSFPAHTCDYDADDNTGLTAIGHAFIFILTDATAANANYLVNVDTVQTYDLKI